jgi:hypothetical protein
LFHKASRLCARKFARRVCNHCRIRKDRRFVIDMESGEEVCRELIDRMAHVGDGQLRATGTGDLK